MARKSCINCFVAVGFQCVVWLPRKHSVASRFGEARISIFCVIHISQFEIDRLINVLYFLHFFFYSLLELISYPPFFSFRFPCPLSNEVTPHHICNLYVLLKLLETHFTRDTNHVIVSFFLLSLLSCSLFYPPFL